MLKLSDNPPVVWPESCLSHASDGKSWFVGHVKSRFEKAFAWDLHAKKIAYFLPMVERVTISGGKKRRGLSPLFPGYVFFCGNREDRYAALLTDRLCQVIEAPEQELLVGELQAVLRVLEQKVPMDFFPHAAVGKRCRVRGGPFEGIEGVVVSREDRKARFVLRVSVLGQGASLEIDGDLLEAAEDAVHVAASAPRRGFQP